MSHPANSKIFTHLLNNGPSTSDELPGYTTFNPELKQDGLRKFHPTTVGQGSSKSGGPSQKTCVYYIHGKHPPRSVVEKWLNVNQATVDAVGEWAIHHRISEYGDDFKDASRELLGPFTHMVDAGKSAGVTESECPFCGEDMYRFPDHVGECPKT